jgi:hypothetical protein
LSGGGFVVNSYTQHMHQTATYWEFVGVDRFGKPAFVGPVQLRCRWQEVAVLFKDSQGQQRTSSAVIYPAYSLALKGYVKLGVDATLDPIGLAGAYEILQNGDSPNLSGTITLNKVFI